jgi:transglutaminase-like putative cysteine protease
VTKSCLSRYSCYRNLSFLIVLTLIILFSYSVAQALSPGFKVVRAGLITPRILAYPPGGAGGAKQPQEELQQSTASAASLQQTLAYVRMSMSSEPAAEITALAASLNNDPKLIFEHVRNNIKYVPYYGPLKGALQTLFDGSGNDCDQSLLLSALIKAAQIAGCDCTSEPVYGKFWNHRDNLANWFAIPTAQQNLINVILGILYLGGIPFAVDQTQTFVIIDRFWVKVTWNGEVYHLDPAVKQYINTDGADIGSAMVYDANAFLASALQGADYWNGITSAT